MANIKKDNAQAKESRAKAVALLENEDPNWGTVEQQLVRATRALAWATVYAGDAGVGDIHIGNLRVSDAF